MMEVPQKRDDLSPTSHRRYRSYRAREEIDASEKRKRNSIIRHAFFILFAWYIFSSPLFLFADLGAANDDDHTGSKHVAVPARVAEVRGPSEYCVQRGRLESACSLCGKVLDSDRAAKCKEVGDEDACLDILGSTKWKHCERLRFSSEKVDEEDITSAFGSHGVSSISFSSSSTLDRVLNMLVDIHKGSQVQGSTELPIVLTRRGDVLVARDPSGNLLSIVYLPKKFADVEHGNVEHSPVSEEVEKRKFPFVLWINLFFVALVALQACW